jgi:hypothetical protein
MLATAPDAGRLRHGRHAGYARAAGTEPVRPSLASLTPEQARLVRALIAAARAEQITEPTND